MTFRNEIKDNLGDKNKQKPMVNNLTEHVNMMPANEVQSLEDLEESEDAEANLLDSADRTKKVAEHDINELYPSFRSAAYD